MNRIFSLYALGAFIALSALHAHARILNVPEDFETIQAGIDEAEEGDTLLVAPGEYYETLQIHRSVVLSSLILTTGDPAYIDSTIIDGISTGTVITAESDAEQAILTIRGFTIRNGLGLEKAAGLHINRFEAVTLKDLLIDSNLGNEIAGGTYGGGISIGDRNNLDQGENSTLTMDRVIVTSNECVRGGGGIALFIGTATLTDCIIVGNYGGMGAGGIHSNCELSLNRVLIASNWSIAGATALFAERGRNHHYDLNQLTVVDNGRRNRNSLIDGEFADGSVISNSIIYDNSEERSEVIYFGQTTDIIYSDVKGGEERIVGDNHNFSEIIDADPLYLDPDNGDYSLSPDSPCIDTGNPDAPLDPDGTRADMGAFYFHQRDIAVDAFDIDFPPTGWGILDSILFPIHNIGGTPLTITSILNSENMACIGVHQFPVGEDSIIIEPFSDYPMFIYYRPDSAALQDVTIFITSNDPDEPEVRVRAIGHVLSAPSDPFSPLTFHLSQPYPNPFNATTTIRFSTGLQVAPTRLAVYDLSGRLVADLFDSHTLPPSHSQTLVWNADGLPGGIYLIRLESGSQSHTVKTILMK